MATRHTLTIPEALAGERLDKALVSLLPEMSRSRLKALMEDGHVSRADGAPLSKPKSAVAAGDVLLVTLPDPVPADPVPQEIALDVRYEDDSLIVVDKPKGLVVHPAPGSADGTLVNALLHHCRGTLSGIGGVERPGIVHRLDKDTSGLMVAAKTDVAHRHLSRQFAERTIRRGYHAVVWGLPSPKEGRVDGNIGRDPKNRQRMAVVPAGGKFARTGYTVLQAWSDLASLVECRLETGRTHQIRVHMAALGHPLVGDPVYGGRHGRARRLNPEARARVAAFKTQALHAFELGFEHPLTGELLEFFSNESLYINELKAFFQSLKNGIVID